MTAQPASLGSVQADQMLTELDAADARRLDDLQIQTHDLDDLDDLASGSSG